MEARWAGARIQATRLVVLLCAVTVLLALPTSAPAKSDHVVKRTGFSISFALRGSNGYRILVTSEGHRKVTLIAERGLLYRASYTAPGRASSRGIDADFGELGRISVRFDGSAPRNRKQRSSRACKGRPTIAQRGSVRGTIHFAGERDFTKVHARHAKASFFRSFRRVCKRRHSTPKFRPPQAPGPTPPSFEFEYSALVAASRGNGISHEFFVLSRGFEFGHKGKRQTFSVTVFGAASQERRDRLTIKRAAFELGDEGAFIVNDPGAYPAVATVTLPKPFSGTATYRQESVRSAPTWAGSLAVRLPGAGPVLLAGEGFEASLCRTRSERRFNICLRKLVPIPSGSAARPLFAQGSGSHSQPLADARLSWSK